ncbi:MAG: hypothetical protein SOX84_02635 [Prevotella sp.]|nr:hypothetical protein [Prevotella sp.]MDY4217667.1 hypothetical protein [Prevotella sp.]
MHASELQNSTPYSTLDEIRLRKAQLHTEILKDENRIGSLWKHLFHKPKAETNPNERFVNLMKSGMGVIDGLILGWKLYKRFGGRTENFNLFGRKKKR